ncbi:hypothetical protein ACO1O0_000127 [Amphichorda felina]
MHILALGPSALHRLVACLLLLAAAVAPQGAAAAAAEVKDDVMQANLVFPQANATYQPVYPFPIVFSIQNARLAWNSTFWIFWDLYDLNTNHWINGGAIGHSQEKPPNNTDIPGDQWLVIQHDDKVVNTTFTELKLYLTFEILDGCNRKQWEEYHVAWPQTYEDRVINKAILFNLSDDGAVPDIEKAGPCPFPIGAINVQDFLTNDEIRTDVKCPLLGASQEDPYPNKACPTSIGAAEATEVASAMLEAAQCTDGTWPDPTGMLGPCPTDNSAGNGGKRASGCALAAVVIMGAVMLLGGHGLESMF